MPLAPEEKPGTSFATDMRLIREQRGLSTQDIYRATKLPLEIVTLFEQTGLINHPRYNRVYLRSFVREYAHVVGIWENDALDGLEAALAGQYRGSLALNYLGMERAEQASNVPVDGPKAGERPGAPAELWPDRRETEPLARQERPATPEARPIAGSRPQKGLRRSAGLPRPLGRILGIAGALLLLMAAIIAVVFLIMQPTSSPASQRAEEPVRVPLPDTVSRPEQEPSVPVLGDTLQVSVVAVGGKLEPIRKQADNGPETPHWIEEGDTLRFTAVNRFSLIGLLNRIELLVDGHPVPTAQRVSDGRLVIRREDVIRLLEARQDTTR